MRVTNQVAASRARWSLPQPARRGGSTAERVKQPARRSLAEEGRMGSADESTTGPATLMLIDRSRLRLPAVANEGGSTARRT